MKNTKENEMTVFLYDEYYEKHNKRPRGFGCWEFKASGNDVIVFQHWGIYTQAKKAAKDYFARIGEKIIISVQP